MTLVSGVAGRGRRTMGSQWGYLEVTQGSGGSIDAESMEQTPFFDLIGHRSPVEGGGGDD